MSSLKEFNSVDLQELQEKAKERTVRTQPIEYDLHTLLNKITNGTIKIDPAYQRRHRWDNPTSSRLIESLVLNIPIPTIYLSQDIDLDTDFEEGVPVFTVIDGQQRLTAIKDFLENRLELCDLQVLSMLNGCTYEMLPMFLKRRLDDRTISALRIDSTLDDQVKYDIFERLNSGSVELTAQELRNATFRGKFNELIKELSKNTTFQVITNMSDSRRRKMEDVELVLRFFALTNGRYKDYKPNMKDYLNASMQYFSNISDEELTKEKERFFERIKAIREALGDEPFAKWRHKQDLHASRFNVAVYDAVITVSDDILEYGRLPENAADALRNLFNDEDFFESISGSVNDSSKLQTRIAILKSAWELNGH